MIVRITFDSGLVMMFGDSYKPWSMQFDEYIWLKKELKPIKVETCKDKWIGWGGLKWCNSDMFQQQLNRECCQENEPDNPKSRQYSEMIFVENKFVKNKVMKIMKNNGLVV